MTNYDSLAVLWPASERHPRDVGNAVRGAPGARPAPGSPLHGDDLLATPFELSAYAHGQLDRAHDLLDSWLPSIAACDEPEASLDLDPEIWAAALLDALDSAVTAVWVLSPEERPIRVTHRLDLALNRFLEIGRILRYAGLPTDDIDEGVRQVAAVAREQGFRVTGHLPTRALLQAAAGSSTPRDQLPMLRALLDAAAHGDPDAMDLLCRIPVRPSRSSSADAFPPSPSLGFRVALAAITSVVLYGETLYDAGRQAPR